MTANLKTLVVGLLLFATLFACGKTDTTGGGLRSTSNIIVNGAGIDGSVHTSTKVLYTLKDIHENQNYTLRTEIGLKSDGSSMSPDGSLEVNIYTSADAFRSDPATPFKSAAPALINSNIYEVNFDAKSSGEYVVVLSGDSKSVPGIQFFYNLRLMSADPKADPAVLSFFTTTAIPAIAERLTPSPLDPGVLNIYNGGDLSSSETFSISLVSNATATIANPQIFVYLDSTLTIGSLMLSSIPTSTDFVVTRFSAGVPTGIKEQPDADLVSSATISSVTISSVTFTGGGPFIVLKGSVTSAVTYTLSIGP